MADRTPPLDVAGFSCPLPVRGEQRIVMGHGGGGVLSAELVDQLFLPAFGDAARSATPTDAAELVVGATRLAFTTDTYVVRPLFFPGGCIGDLAVNGTVNDLAMRGARPLALSTGFVLEEGLELDLLGRVAAAMGAAASAAGVELVTGDTKVVEAGHGDGLYVNTAGIGIVPDGVDLRPERAAPGDVVLVSGPVGAHGIAVLSLREGLEFGTELRSDTAALNGLVAAMLDAAPAPGDVHVLRDPTRGGLAASTCEIAGTARVGIALDESSIPVPEEVRAACGFLGLDPLQVANEGRLVAIVAPAAADAVLAAMRGTAVGAGATRIGVVTDAHPGVVTARTGLGATRIVDRPLGEQLPRNLLRRRMHELSICTAIVGIAERHADGRPVERVRIDVGGLRQVVPETLAACWEIAVLDTRLAGAVLDITHVPAAITCRTCGARTVLDHPVFRCGGCAGRDVEVASGEELHVTSLVLKER